MKIQFLLLSDGVSHKILGINVVRGLQQLGIEADYYFPSRGSGRLMENPDYVFVLKPNSIHVELIKSFGNSTVCLIVNDQMVSNDILPYIDFYVSPSINWQTRHSPCYLVKEEFDYYTAKVHTPNSFKLVFTGYKENLITYLAPVIDIITEKYTDLTIVSNFTKEDVVADNKLLPESFYKCTLKRFNPSIWDDVLSDVYGRGVIEQFKEYDVGIKVQPIEKSQRTSNGIKIFMYAGLPVVASYNENNANLWFNKAGERVCLVYDPSMWIKHLDYLRDYKTRQQIVDENFELIKKNAGVIESAESFLEAINLYEHR